MGFFNSLSTRVPLAIIGGILYSLLTYYILILFDLPSQFAIPCAMFVFLFYLGSRLLILFSGIDSPYYSKKERGGPKQFYKGSSFYQTTQWVGTFYHYHDIVFFIFLAILSIAFPITLIIDASWGNPAGDTFQSILNAFLSLLQ
jgi:hypothetical protein